MPGGTSSPHLPLKTEGNTPYWEKKGVVIQELGESTTTISSQQSQDKAEFDEEERLARKKAEKEEKANIALI
ncbi:hypothetical protein Tco_0836881 [Tanacetum coccineum]